MHGYSHWNETPVLLVSQASIDDGYHLLSTDYLIGAPPSYNVNRLSRFFAPQRTPDRTDLFHHYRVQYPRGPPDIIYLPSQGLNDEELARESRQLEYVAHSMQEHITRIEQHRSRVVHHLFQINSVAVHRAEEESRSAFRPRSPSPSSDRSRSTSPEFRQRRRPEDVRLSTSLGRDLHSRFTRFQEVIDRESPPPGFGQPSHAFPSERSLAGDELQPTSSTPSSPPFSTPTESHPVPSGSNGSPITERLVTSEGLSGTESEENSSPVFRYSSRFDRTVYFSDDTDDEDYIQTGVFIPDNSDDDRNDDDYISNDDSRSADERPVQEEEVREGPLNRPPPDGPAFYSSGSPSEYPENTPPNPTTTRVAATSDVPFAPTIFVQNPLPNPIVDLPISTTIIIGSDDSSSEEEEGEIPLTGRRSTPPSVSPGPFGNVW